MDSFYSILAAKASRVFVFGIASIMTPVYVAILGYSPLYVGLVLAVIVAGNIFSNILLTRLGKRIGIRGSLTFFSLLMLGSGLILFATSYFPFIVIACFIGNISTTGTEAGPFQSIETGILPNIVRVGVGRAFGAYNLIGYISSAVGALTASLPSYFSESLVSFRYLYLVYGLVGLLLFILYRNMKGLDYSRETKPRVKERNEVKKDITNLSILFGLDAFGGGFVSQSLLSYWFFLFYKISLGELGGVFFVVGIITALSILVAPILGERIGNLRTMVLTHLLSNVFLVAIPFAGSAIPALIFLFLRQSVSQMDVPTRQTFMVSIFEREDRVNANAITNTARSIASIFGAPLSGALLSISLYSIPILTGGFSKIAYDFAIFSSYRKRTK